MKKMKHLFMPLVLGVIAVLTHREWFNFGTVISFWDFNYYFDEPLKQLIHVNTWIASSGFGKPNIELYKNAVTAAFSLFGNLGLGFTDSVRLTHLIPVALFSFFSPYILLYYIYRDKQIAFTGSMFFTSSVFLSVFKYLGHESIALIVALSPLYVYLFLRCVKEDKARLWFGFAVMYWLGTCYEFRMMYVVTILLALAALFYLDLASLRKVWYKLLLSSIGVAALSAYWVLPTVLGGFSDSISTVAERGLWGSAYYSLIQSFALFNHSWSGASPTIFQPNAIPWYFWLSAMPVAITACLSLKHRARANYYYFWILYLVGLLLTKQEGEPLPGAFQFFRDVLPGFVVFRSSPKFYFLLMIGATGLLSLLLVALKGSKNILLKKYAYSLFTAIVLIVSGYNLKPLFTQGIGGMLTKKEVPIGYSELSIRAMKDMSFSRTLWLPIDSRWSFSSNFHPKISGADALASAWSESSYFVNDKRGISERASEIYLQPFADWLLDVSSIKYVIIPLEDVLNGDNFFKAYGKGREFFVEKLRSSKYLRETDIVAEGLTIFENTGYRPYIRSIDRLFSFPEAVDLAKKVDFFQQVSPGGFDYVIQDETKSSKDTTGVSTVFENVFRDVIDTNGVLKEDVQSGGVDSSVYANLSSGGIYYSLDKRKLKLVIRYPGAWLNVDAKNKPFDESEKLFYESTLTDGGDYYVELNGVSTKLVSGQAVFLGVMSKNDTLNIYRSNENVIQNGSFEQGLWRKSVVDCHNYDGNGLVSMELSSEARLQGKKSLQLTAVRHIACTYTKFTIKPGESYALDLSYLSNSSKKAGYYLQFNDEKKTVIKNQMPISDDRWHRYSKNIAVPFGASEASLYLYAYASDDSHANIVNYDDIKFVRIGLVGAVNLPDSWPAYESVPLSSPDGVSSFSFKDPEYRPTNIFENGSFDQGAWQREVSDCHNYDDRPAISMAIDARYAPEMGLVLALTAQRHDACTITNVNVSANSTYSFSFRYQGDMNGQAGYYIQFNDEEKTRISQKLLINGVGWNEYVKTIVVPKGADAASIYAYAYESDGISAITIRYDDFSLVELPRVEDAFYLVDDLVPSRVHPKDIVFDLINPTKKLVHIKGATTPFFLGMSESYHDQWQLQFNNANVQGWLKRWWPFAKPDRIANGAHYKLDGFLNAWYVDTDALCGSQALCTKNADGSYDLEMVIEFWPQRWFYLGLLISGSTLAGCLGYLGYDGVRSLRRRYVARKERAPVSTESV